MKHPFSFVVLDQQGNVVNGAAIAVRDINTHAAVTIYDQLDAAIGAPATNANGILVGFLNPGVYEWQGTKAGFSTDWTAFEISASSTTSGGRELGSASYNTANVATPAGGAATDVPGVSVAFTASDRPVLVIAGAQDMINNTAGQITIFQVVRTDTGAPVCAVRGGGTNYPANMRLPVGSIIGRMGGLTPGNVYTVKAQVFAGGGTATLMSGNAGGFGAMIEVLEV